MGWSKLLIFIKFCVGFDKPDSEEKLKLLGLQVPTVKLQFANLLVIFWNNPEKKHGYLWHTRDNT